MRGKPVSTQDHQFWSDKPDSREISYSMSTNPNPSVSRSCALNRSMALCWARIMARKNESVARGDPVKVIAVDGLELTVEKLEE